MFRKTINEKLYDLHREHDTFMLLFFTLIGFVWLYFREYLMIKTIDIMEELGKNFNVFTMIVCMVFLTRLVVQMIITTMRKTTAFNMVFTILFFTILSFSINKDLEN